MISIKFIHNPFLKILMALVPFGAAAQSIHIMPNGRLVANGAVNIVLNDMAFTNDGSFTAGSSTVHFAGVKSANIGGSSITGFSNLTINKSSNSVQIVNDINVSGVIAMTRGNLLLNNHTVDLGITGRVSGEANNRSILGDNGGSIKATYSNNSTPLSALNPGNLGAEITSASIMGNGVVTRSHIAEALPNAGVATHRRYDITSSRKTGSDATLRLFYLDTELNSNNESLLLVWTGVTNNLTPLGRDSANTSANWVLKSGVANQLGHFVLGNDSQSSFAGNAAANRNINPADEAAVKLQVYPNPVRDHFSINLYATVSREIQLSLTDQSGRLLQRKEWHVAAGSNTILWNMSTYTAGIYYLSVNNASVKNVKIIKE